MLLFVDFFSLLFVLPVILYTFTHTPAATCKYYIIDEHKCRSSLAAECVNGIVWDGREKRNRWVYTNRITRAEYLQFSLFFSPHLACTLVFRAFFPLSPLLSFHIVSVVSCLVSRAHFASPLFVNVPFSESTARALVPRYRSFSFSFSLCVILNHIHFNPSLSLYMNVHCTHNWKIWCSQNKTSRRPKTELIYNVIGVCVRTLPFSMDCEIAIDQWRDS